MGAGLLDLGFVYLGLWDLECLDLGLRYFEFEVFGFMSSKMLDVWFLD